MVKMPGNSKRIFVALELACLGFLCWVVLSGMFTKPNASTNGGPTGAQKQVIKQEKKAKKQKKNQERFIPPEGQPELHPALVTGAAGTTVSCSTFDFAGGATQGFTTQAVFGTPLILWHVVNGTCRAFLTGHSTPYTFYYGQDISCNYNTGARNASNLISPPISLAGKFAPFTVSFNYLLFVEGGGFDTTFVDISTDNGTTWTQFLSKANLINDNQWHNIVANVTALVGAATSVRLRFRFDSIDNIANSTTGWHVDDLSVCGEEFNVCVQDDKTQDFVRVNTVTGHFVTQQCSSGFVFDGVGTVTTNGSVVTVTQNTTGRFNKITVDTAAHTGSASIRVVNGFTVKAYNITDSNTLNNTCGCP